MMKKNTLFLALLLAAAMLFLAACGGQAAKDSNDTQASGAQQTSQDSQSTNEQPKPKELRVLYATVEAGSEAILDAAKKYEAERGIKITVDTFPYNNLQEKAFSELTQGSDYYDLICIDTPWVPEIAGHLEPMTQYIKNTKNPELLAIDDFIAKVFLDTSVFDIDAPHKQPPQMDVIDVDKITGAGFDITSLPIQSNVLVVSYRKDLFEDEKYIAEFKQKYGRDLAIPNTFEEYVDIAKFFTRDTNNDGKIDIYGTTLMANRHESSFCDFKSFLANFGGSIFNDNMKPIFNNQAGVSALEEYGSWINKEKITPPGAITYTWDEVATAFGSGLTAMGMNYHDMKLDPNVNGKVGYFIFPGVKNGGNVVRGPHFGSWGLSISKYSKNKEAAYKLAEWLTSPERQEGYLKFNQHVTRLSSYKAAESISDPLLREYYQVMGESLKVGVGRPRITTYNRVSEAVQIAISDYLTNKKGAKEALDQAAKQVEDIMKEAGYYK